MKKKQKLTLRERKFVTAKVKGKTNAQAYLDAGYSPSTDNTMRVAGSVIKNRPHVQEAIETALEARHMTPEWAVGELKKVAEQDEELGAKRLAIKDSLELMGWKKNERPSMQLDIRNAFFGEARQVRANNEASSETNREIIDADSPRQSPEED